MNSKEHYIHKNDYTYHNTCIIYSKRLRDNKIILEIILFEYKKHDGGGEKSNLEVKI